MNDKKFLLFFFTSPAIYYYSIFNSKASCYLFKKDTVYSIHTNQNTLIFDASNLVVTVNT